MSEEYRTAIESCNDFQTLFSLWKNKSPRIVDFEDQKMKKRFEINHKDTVFISDGVVNPQVWDNQRMPYHQKYPLIFWLHPANAQLQNISILS